MDHESTGRPGGASHALGAVCLRGEEAVLHVMGLPRWGALGVRARSLRVAAVVAGWAAGRGSGGRCACPPASLAQGIRRAAMSPAAFGGRIVEPRYRGGL